MILNDLLTGNGVLSLPWWGYVLITLVATHLTIISVTLFLHRCQAHLAVNFHPAITHPMRFWLWITTGMVTRAWVSIHRKHHTTVETEDDPHSPRTHGILTVLFKGTELYRKEATNEDTLKIYGRGTPEDWIEKHLYAKHSIVGIVLLLVLSYILFGFTGISMWAVQMIWIPFLAAGVINGGGHFFGYRNYQTDDDSTNLSNIGLLIGGEELHNNHHAFPGSAKFSSQPWEFDVGWMYIKLLSSVKLAQVKRIMPPRKVARRVLKLDTETVQALLQGRLHVMADYMNMVMHPVFKQETRRAKRSSYLRLLKGVKKSFLHHESGDLSQRDNRRLKLALGNSSALKTAYEFRQRLQSLWQDLRNDHEKLRVALLEWCHQAETSGVHLLEEFARRIKGGTEIPATLISR